MLTQGLGNLGEAERQHPTKVCTPPDLKAGSLLGKKTDFQGKKTSCKMQWFMLSVHDTTAEFCLAACISTTVSFIKVLSLVKKKKKTGQNQKKKPHQIINRNGADQKVLCLGCVSPVIAVLCCGGVFPGSRWLWGGSGDSQPTIWSSI